jgi:hypothetical protein
MILGGYPLGVMAKKTDNHPCITKNEMPTSMGIIFFEAPTTTLCLVRCLCNQHFMNPFEAHSNIFSFV